MALALHLAGVPAEVIAADYAASPALSVESALPEMAAPQGETMTTILEHLVQTYGGVPDYLIGGGATPDHFSLLTARLFD